MKNRILNAALFAALALASVAAAQPQGFNYQALVRDGAGAPVKGKAVGVRIRLHQDSAGGAVSYAETFTPNTNNFGNINLIIGKGAAVSGTFSSLDWSHSMFVEIGVDANGGTSYTDLGTTQLMSVPYAMYAGKSAATSGADVSEIHDADKNTAVSTEKNANENIIRFNLSGTEKMRLRGYALEFPNNANSVYIGDSAGSAATSGAYSNVAVGSFAGHVNASGQNNTFVGAGAGSKNAASNNNTFLGAFSGLANTTGIENAFVGQSAGTANTTGSNNAFFGSAAGPVNTVGAGNTFLGFSSGYSNTAASNNTMTGYNAGYATTTGASNTFNGAQAGLSNTTAASNTFIGASSGKNHTTGNSNTYLGALAGNFDTTGTGNVFLGYLAGPYVNESNKLYISNSSGAPLIWGDFATDSVRVNGGMSVLRSVTATAFNTGSDRRLKENIQPLPNALESLGKINGVSYHYKAKAPDGNSYPQGRQIGVIAQDVEKVYPELVATSANGYKAVDYPKLTAVLIEAVKEQQKTIEGQRSAMAEFKAGNAALSERLAKVEQALRLSRVDAAGPQVAKTEK